MPNAVAQWSIDQFYAALQSVWSLANKAKAGLAADRQQLIHLWSVTKTEDPATAAAHQATLNPLIHQNSVLRTQYLTPLAAKFQEAVNAGSRVLDQAGYKAPTLAGYNEAGTGLGIVPALVVVPAAAIAAIVVALSAASILANLTETQRKNTANAAAIIQDKSLTPAQRTAQLSALAAETKASAEAAAKSNPFGGLDIGKLVPILGLVAIIMLGPQIMRMFPGRKVA
jgi:hypothetical protein